MSLPHLRDLSHWNQPVDWQAEKKRGLWGVYQQRLRNATYAGFWRIGAYLFTVPGSGSPQAQADHLLKLAPLAPYRLRPCLDVESNPLGLPPQKLSTWLADCVARIEQRTGYLPVIYGPPSFFSSFAASTLEGARLFGRCPLWLADYAVITPSVPDPWIHYAAWQYTDRFQDPAAHGAVDDTLVSDGRALQIPIRAKGTWLIP